MRPSITSLALVVLSLPAFSLATAGVAIPQAATARPATLGADRSTQRGTADALRQERTAIREQIEDLASPDFEVRKRAAKRLEAYGRKAKALLQETVLESEDAEQVWQARRLLRRLEKGRPALKSGARRQSRSGSKRQSKTDSRTDSKSSSKSSSKEDSKADAKADAKTDAKADAKVDAKVWGSPGGFAGKMHSEATIVTMGPEGVEVDITVTEDGKKRRKTYKAASMEELLRKFPELKGKVGGFSMKSGISFGPGTLRGIPFDKSPFGKSPFGSGAIEDMEKQIERMERRLRELMRGGLGGLHRGHRQDNLPKNNRLESMPESGPKLGVFVGTGETSSVGRFLGLPDGVGLWVEGLKEGSLAERLGLTKGDFLVQLDGRWIRGPKDVASVLADKQVDKEAGREKAPKLQAQWYRKGKKMQKSVGF